nr:TonB-dependent receptor [Candidatus Eremiobacteraeota bacterium]
ILSGAQVKTTTDGAGKFTLTLAIGTYRIDVNRGGYTPIGRDGVVVVAGQVLPLDVALEAADLGSLKSIGRVTTSAHGSINTGASASSGLTRREIQDSANPQVNDIVQRIPGAGIERGSSSPNTSISLGGSQPYETQVLLDGHPLSAGRYGVYFSQFFGTGLLQGIETQSGPGNTTPFASTAIGGTANLTTPGFTSKPTFEFTSGVDNFAAQYSSLLTTGKVGRVSYVLGGAYQGLNGPYFQHNGCIVKPANYSTLNTPAATGIIQSCGDLSGPLTTKGELFKLKYDFSQATSLELGFTGSQAGYNPQGIAYAQYGGTVTVVPCFGSGAGQQCSSPQYPTGQQINAYIFYPGSLVTNNQPIFTGQLRTALGNNTLLIRPYLGNITRAINGAGEANYPDHYFNPVNNVGYKNCPKSQLGPIQNGLQQCLQSPFSLLESDKLKGSTISFIHPFGQNVLTGTYDYHSDETFAYYGDPSSINTPDTTSKFQTLSLIGDLAVRRNLIAKVGAYYTNWNLTGKQAGPIVGGKPTLIPSSRTASRFDPHLSLIFAPSPGLSYRASYGTSATFPYASLVSGIPFITKPSATAPLGTFNLKNPGLNPEVATSFDLGMDKRFHNGGVLSFDLLSNQVRNVFESIITPVSGQPNYSAIVQPVNAAKLNAQLAMLTYRYSPNTGLGFFATGTLARSVVTGVPSIFFTSPAVFVQPANDVQQCSNGGSEVCIPYLKAYGQLNYTGRDRTYYALGVDFEGKNNTYNQPPFAVYDLTLRRPVRENLEVQLAVQNLLNTNNFSNLPEFNLGVPQIGQSSTGLGSIIVPRLPAPARTFRLQFRFHVGRE